MSVEGVQIMKKISLALTVLMILTVLISTGTNAKAESGATSANTEAFSNEAVEMDTLTFRGKTYYLVFTEEQLRAVAAGQFGWDKNYMQQADIQLSSDEWLPIGTENDPFTGSYNGNGYEITGLTMKSSDAELAGLFGYAKGAHLYNIALRDVDIDAAGSSTDCNKDAICAMAEDCRIYDNEVYKK